MEFVKIPLSIAQRAARHFRPLMPYVRKHIAEQRAKGIVIDEAIENPVTTIEPVQIIDSGKILIQKLEEYKASLESKTIDELKYIADKSGLKLKKGLKKKEIIERLLQ